MHQVVHQLGLIAFLGHESEDMRGNPPKEGFPAAGKYRSQIPATYLYGIRVLQDTNSHLASRSSCVCLPRQAVQKLATNCFGGILQALAPMEPILVSRLEILK